jgi:hypothetical protein
MLAAIDSVFNARPLATQASLGLAFNPPRDGALLFHDSLLGRTLEWDSTRNGYAATARPGAPSRGVRAILYAIAGFATEPSQPYFEVGTTDQIHERPGSTTDLRTIVRGTDGTVYGNYVVDAVLGTNGFELTAGGPLTLGDRRLDMTAYIAIDNVSFFTDNTLSLPARGLTVHSVVRGTRSTSGQSASATFVLRGGDVVMDMFGDLTQTIAGGVSTTRADVTLRLNGNVFARIHGTDPNVTFLDGEGNPLPLDRLVVVQRVFGAPDRLYFSIARLLQPTVNLLSGYVPPL